LASNRNARHGTAEYGSVPAWTLSGSGFLPAILLALVSGCSEAPGNVGGGGPPGDPGDVTPRFTYAGPVLMDLPPLLEEELNRHETERDWAIVRGTLEWARSREFQELPPGELAAVLGTTFVGTPYEPGTLELPGEERLVVNLRGFDCVTLVEHLAVLSRITLTASPSLLADESELRDRYRDEVTLIRYRGGEMDGYASRLHYFSEWLQDAEAKGILRDMTRELGGVVDPRPIHFMSSNPSSYRQLAEDPMQLEAVRATEGTLNERVRYYIPQERIAEIESRILNGDVIAAVSTVDGLDVAHTGIAIRHAGRVHLLHAPLVGDSVEISERPLAERILGISGQQGVIVARLLAP